MLCYMSESCHVQRGVISRYEFSATFRSQYKKDTVLGCSLTQAIFYGTNYMGKVPSRPTRNLLKERVVRFRVAPASCEKRKCDFIDVYLKCVLHTLCQCSYNG